MNIDEVIGYLRKNEKQLTSIDLMEEESVTSSWMDGSPRTVEIRTRITIECTKVELKRPPTHKEELKP